MVETFDIAIIGAGVSGVYAAWRLKSKFPDKAILVLESSNRIGGRLLSVRPPEIPDMVAELGGMRILPEVQPRIMNLITRLNKELPSDSSIELYDFPVDQPNNLAYLRGVHLRLSDFQLHPKKVPYRVSFLESGLSAGQILINAIEQIVPGITRVNLTEEDRRKLTATASFNGVPLYKQGFWNVLMRVISGEAYLLGVDAGGYSSTLMNWNAADAIPWFLSDFGTNAKYRGFRKGFQQVPLSLAELFRKAGGVIRTECPASTIHRHDQGGYTVTVPTGTIRASALILAMPRRAIELLTPNSIPLQQISELLASVTPRPLFKLFTTFANPWWRSAGCFDNGHFIPVEAGRSVTDLPVRQTYYWPQVDGKPREIGRAMLMASYDDGAHVGFWDGLRERRHQPHATHRETAAPTDAYVGSADTAAESAAIDPVWKQHAAPRRLVQEALRQLAIMHGVAYTPEARSAAFRDWGDDPFGGGWHSWNIGVKSDEVKRRIIQPFAGESFHICGEAYSDAQGWVEGALQTADMMLEMFEVESL